MRAESNVNVRWRQVKDFVKAVTTDFADYTDFDFRVYELKESGCYFGVPKNNL